MSDGTKIEWTEATWNPITGCSLASPGCTNCYAMKLAGTRLQHHSSRKGLTIDTKAGPVWNGTTRFNEEWLDQPLRWKRPRMIFVCAHGDLFHESVPDEWIDRVFAVMALAPQHTFQVLTKRAERMREYLAQFEQQGRYVVSLTREQIGNDRRDGNRLLLLSKEQSWPLPNVWLGVSVEDQKRAKERIPHLLATPAAVRWLSCEPLLEEVDLTSVSDEGTCLDPECWGDCACDDLYGHDSGCRRNGGDGHLERKIDWVVCGGESGPGARPMHPDWARSLRDQCAEADVPFFFKQWGEWKQAIPRPSETPGKFAMMARDPSGWTHSNATKLDHYPRQFACFGSIVLECVGKKAAGRLLDGAEHNGMPEEA